jgi:hypothetical protein
MHFFIAGSQRTGTTLLRSILECHSRVFCYDEPRSYAILAGEAHGVVPDETRAETHVGFEIPCWTEQLGQPVVSHPGTPDVVRDLYQGQPILFMLRDVRDTIASMMALKNDGRSWLERWGESILSANIERDAAFRDRYARELACRETSDRRSIASGAVYWKYKTAAYFDYVARGYPVLGVRYDELVSQPEPVLRIVCAFLGLPWTPELLQHPAFPHMQVDRDGFAIGRTDSTPSIHTRSLDRWRESLTVRDVAAILEIAGDLQERINAEVSMCENVSR